MPKKIAVNKGIYEVEDNDDVKETLKKILRSIGSYGIVSLYINKREVRKSEKEVFKIPKTFKDINTMRVTTDKYSYHDRWDQEEWQKENYKEE